MPAVTFTPAFGYIRFASAKQGYFQDGLVYNFSWNRYEKEELEYFKEWFKMKSIPFVSLSSGFEYMLSSHPAGMYANFEVGKFLGNFVPQSEIYYRDEDETVKVTYDGAHGLGLKGNIGIIMQWGKPSTIGKNLPSGRK
jgi:hypothetical protein